MRIHHRALCGVAAISLLLAGCQSPMLYHWGSYQDIVYASFKKPDKVPASVQIEQLTTEIAKAESKGLKVAPGIRAHLAFAYWENGNLQAARDNFTREKETYPESTTFMDHFLAKLPQS